MARIRSIKPSFFLNEDLACLSFAHRLCFVGLWTAADREGRLEDRPRRLKAALFPYDDIDMDVLLTDLAEKGFIVRYDADGAPAISIPHFLKHQRPKNDEHVSLIPAPSLEHPRGIRAAPRIGDRTLGGRKVGGMDTADGAVSSAPADGAAAEAFQALWNDTTSLPIPRCRDLTSKRRRHIKARLSERSLEAWGAIMARIQASKFCRGEVARGNGDQPWVAAFDWLIGSPDVAVKVLEGAYDDRKPARVAAAAPQPTYSFDWFDECKEIHEGECSGQSQHSTRKIIEAGRAARQSA